MISTSPKLRDELEVIRGMDDIPLIYDPVTGNYHRITRAGEVVLNFLDGTRSRDDLIQFFADHNRDRSDTVKRQLDGFLTSLADSGLLVGTDLPEKAPRPGARVRTSMFMPRVIISRALPTLLEPLARVLRRVPAWILAGLAAAAALTGFAFGFHTLFTGVPPLTQIIGPAFIVATAAQLLLVLAHETSHALTAQVLGVPVRGLGVALLFYFMPVAYVDRTDAYRLRGRGGRVALALAGIASDGVFCGLTGLVALNSTGFVQHTAAFLLGMQLLGIVINLNPLLPSDGYTAIEAATGLVDARGRAFALLRNVASRKELPAHLANLSTRARITYMAYGLVSAAYICFLAYSVLHTIPVMVRLALSMVGR
ncbi:hypothetical protein DQ384_14680 [Sphaerisporangium album]|uniref:PqqD family peptide modification chaperone n=1 Tax=Sphaerisporangium album TaxID=509200 RepID=A0A367FKY0_9ACTN|nr:hypothetical protein [Sphaerisporangium album]RCG30549.1 hypothetical protein DQ384_14680 [Sphaerisporangium album]